MNILFIANHLNIGGITSYTLTLARGLEKKGHNVYLASSGGSLLPAFIDSGIEYAPIPIKTKKEINPKIIYSAFILSALIREKQIDIIHSQSRTTQVLGALLRKFTGVPYISTCHGFFKKRILRKIFPCWGKKVIAISAQVKEHLIKDFKVKESDIEVIHNGIEVEKYKPQATGYRLQRRKDLGLKDGPVIGIVARLSDVKGHQYLIEAMPMVVEKIPQAQLLIVGSGKMQGDLQSRAQDLGIRRNIFFIPEVSDTREVLGVMDLFVMPSLNEGLGLAIIEAMAQGLAVIGSSVGGIKTLIQDGSTGILIGPADSHAIAKAITELLEDKQKREYLGNNARVFIQKNFSQEIMVNRTERVYQECLS